MQGWDPFKDSFRMVERFGERFRGFLAQEAGDDAHEPPADVVEDREGVTYSVELPGVAPDQVTLTLVAGTLVVEAERSFAHRHDRKVSRLEGRYGRMRRVFALPPGARERQAVAELQQGVLRVFVPCEQPTATTQRGLTVRGEDAARPVPIQ